MPYWYFRSLRVRDISFLRFGVPSVRHSFIPLLGRLFPIYTIPLCFPFVFQLFPPPIRRVSSSRRASFRPIENSHPAFNPASFPLSVLLSRRSYFLLFLSFICGQISPVSPSFGDGVLTFSRLVVVWSALSASLACFIAAGRALRNFLRFPQLPRFFPFCGDRIARGVRGGGGGSGS